MKEDNTIKYNSYINRERKKTTQQNITVNKRERKDNTIKYNS